jgi:hypothetical protein
LLSIVSRTIGCQGFSEQCEAGLEHNEEIGQYQLPISNLINSGLNSSLLAPVYEMETTTIKVPYIINELSARAIAKVIFQPDDRADYESL